MLVYYYNHGYNSIILHEYYIHVVYTIIYIYIYIYIILYTINRIYGTIFS